MKYFQKTKLQKVIALGAAFLATGSIWAVSTATVSAAANQLYLSPATVSVQNGDSFSVNLRVNPSTSIDTVTASIGYDSSKLSLAGVDCSGSPMTAFPTCPTSGNPVSLTSYIPGGSVSSDSFIAKLTFTAKVGSGSSSITLSGDTASGGNSLGASTSGATVNFTTPTAPPPSCPAGTTGTYPNCVTVPTGGTGGTGGSAGGGTKTTTGGGTTSTKPSGGTSTPTPIPTVTTNATATVSNVDVKFTLATFSTSSKDPSQVYIQFGTSKDSLTQQTKLSELGTTHTVSIDPSQLVPGQTYYYVLVSKSQTGEITQTAVNSFTMNGLTVRIGVYDKNHKPLANKSVTLHSNPMTAQTDNKGFVNFTNVIPGSHQLQYVAGGKTYTQQISVDNNVATAGASQTAPVQTVAVVYNLTASNSLAAARWVILGLLVVVVVIGALLYSQRKIRFAAPGGAPLSVEPIIVGDGKAGHSTPDASSTPTTHLSTAAETGKRLENIASPNKPLPGSTVTPIGINTERKQF